MTTWLADASVLLAREDVDDANHDGARSLLSGPDPVATLDLAYYEVTIVAVRAWHDLSAARRLRGAVRALQDDGGLVRCDEALVAAATELTESHDLSTYDAAYVAAAVAAAITIGARLVSCDIRDLVCSGFAVLPGEAVG